MQMATPNLWQSIRRKPRRLGTFQHLRTGRLRTELLEDRWLLASNVIPEGSLVERTALGPGSIGVSGEIDSFTVALDAGQTVTVIATSSGGLAPSVTLRSPANIPLGTASAAANATALLQTVAAADAGAYKIEVTGSGGATGSYDLTYILNAAAEAEQYGGGSNNSAATAQDLASSFIDVATGPTVTRGAVVGRLDNATADFFSFAVPNGQVASLALGASVEGAVLEVYDATGTTLLARGIAAENVAQSINGFVGATSYLAKVTANTAPAGSEYTLVVTLGADFENEANPSFDMSQSSSTTLGHVTTQDFSGTTLLTEFAGMDFNSTTCGCQPPDTHAAVGPDHIVEAVNTAITFYTKDGTSVFGPVEFENFFTPAIVAGEQFLFDPVVAYDEQIGRFIIAVLSAQSSSSAESDLLYAVSNTADPTQGFTEQHRINFDVVSPGLFADYPKIGWNGSTHTFSLNMFGASFSNVDILSIDKSTVTDANPNTFSSFIVRSPNSFAALDDFTMAVATMHESQPGDPMWFVEEQSYNGGNNIRVVKMANQLSANPTFTTYDVPVNSYSAPVNAPQAGGGSFETNDARMLNAEFRDGRLVATHAVGISGRTMARWYEFNTTGVSPTLTQQGNVDPGAGIHTYFPSIAINNSGDIGITYMQSSSSQFVSMYVTGQAFGSVPGTLAESVLVKAGNENYSGFRGGDYSGITVDPVTDTFWAANEVSLNGPAPNPLWSTWIGEFAVAPLPDDDWYAFSANFGDNLSVRTYTPFSGPNRIENLLDPVIELYAPDGSFVTSDDNSAGDGINALVNHTAGQTGDYRVHVLGANESAGSYLYRVSGSTAANEPPEVVAVNPADGMVLPAFPATITLDFSEGILFSSVTANDLTIGGVPASMVTVVDGDTLQFTLNPAANVGDGSYSVVLGAGAVTDYAAAGNLAFASTFVLDTTGPRILATTWNSLPFPGSATFDPGALTFTATMSEGLSTYRSARFGLRSPGPDDVILTETVTGQAYAATAVDFDTFTNTFTAEFPPLPEGNFRLRLLSGDGSFEDKVGNDLDGEPNGGGDGTITGNGVPGGDYFVDFVVDLNSGTVGVKPFQRWNPLGSLVASSDGNSGFLNFPGDVDPFGVQATAGETLAAVATPGNAGTTLSIQLGGTTVTATGPGQPVVLPVQAITSTGSQILAVDGDIPSNYTLTVYRNANTAALTEGGAVSIDGSEFNAGDGRFAAIGASSGSIGLPTLSHYNNPALFIDIAATGTPLNLGDDAEATITTTVGNSLFPAGPTTIGNNGVVASGGGRDISTSNSALPTTSFAAAMVPMWDDIDSDTGNVYWEQRSVGGINTLIVQWDDRPRYNNIGDTTFQVQLFASGPIVARYVYRDVVFGNPQYDFGASATVGFQINATSALQYSFNTPSLADGDVIDVVSVAPTVDVDEFTIDLTGRVGSQLDVAIAGRGTSFADQTLELLNPSGTPVATGSSTPLGTGAAGIDLAILAYPVTVPGVYTVRLSSMTSGRYALVVTDDVRLDLEPNNSISNSLRSVEPGVGALGFLQGSTVNFVKYNDAGTFVDISSTGTPLNLTDDSEATINTTVGNTLMPAGAVTVGNNGGIMSGSGVDLPVSNTGLPTSIFSAALLPFWDDIDADTGNVYWEERTIDGIQALIVQWEDRPRFSNIGNATFQLQLFETGPVAARFAYQDVVFGDPQYDFGASATVGYQISATSGAAFSQDAAVLANGDVIDLLVYDTDIYSLALAPGETVTISTRTPLDDPGHNPLNSLDPALQILDASGIPVAADSNSAPDGKNALLSFTAGASGPYYVAVTNEMGSGEYALLVQSTLAGDFDADGDLDCDDVDSLTQAIASGSTNLLYDVTNDNQVNLADLDEWVLNLKGTLFGDANLDFAVDGSDFIIWNANKFASGKAWCTGDFNADGITDGLDFVIWNQFKFMNADLRGRSLLVPSAVNSGVSIQPQARTELKVEVRVEMPRAILVDSASLVSCLAQPVPSASQSAISRSLPVHHVESIFAELDKHNRGA